MAIWFLLVLQFGELCSSWVVAVAGRPTSPSTLEHSIHDSSYSARLGQLSLRALNDGLEGEVGAGVGNEGGKTTSKTTHTHIHTHTLFLTYTLTHSLTHTLTHTLTLSHTHTP